MIGLDTNVLLRLLLRDDADQADRANAFIEASCSAEAPCFINRIVLVETAWVLRSGYGYRRDQVAGIIDGILRTEIFIVEGAPEVWSALAAFRDHGADFADCLIAATNRVRGCETLVTFDRGAAALPGVEVI
jgi:predicted nucleic-acid-binding protein